MSWGWFMRLVLGLSAAAALSLVSCSKGTGETSVSKGPAAGGPAAPAAPASGSAETIDPAIAPVDVAGAFLADVKCGDFDPSTALNNIDGAEVFLGCIFEGKADAKRVPDLSDYQLEITLDDGKKVTPKVRDTEETSGWHFAFHIERGHQRHLKTLAATAQTKAKARGGSETGLTNYDFSNDAEFQAWKGRLGEALFFAFQVVPAADCALPPDFRSDGIPEPRIYPLPAAFLAKPYQLVFAIHQRVRPAIGLAGADAACNEAGKSVDAARTWKAILSTSTENARDRVQIHGPVFNTLGYIYARNADEFWIRPDKDDFGPPIPIDWVGEQFVLPTVEPPHGHFYNGLFSQCGLRFRELYNAAFPLAFRGAEVTSWTGSRNGGTYDEVNGSCKDWTSDDAGDYGTAGRAHTWDNSFFRIDEIPHRSCDLRGFLACVSQ